MDDKTFVWILSKTKKYRVATSLDKSFCELTTLGVGGKIKITLFPDTVKKLIRTVKLLTKHKVNYVLLGRGSNVLAADGDYDGVVVVTTGINKMRVKGNRVVAECGASTIAVAKKLQQAGLSGGEFFACLPATVGGALTSNAGCFGQDVKGILSSVTVLNCGKVRTMSVEHCQLTKRNSIFKQNGGVVLSAKFKLIPSTAEDVKLKMEEMRQRKAKTQPLNYRSAGCMLYHDKVAISYLTDKAGLKGYTVGGAQVSPKHAGFILNVDKATAKDIYLLVQHVADTVWQRYGIRAKLEVCLVNFTKDDNDIFAER